MTKTTSAPALGPCCIATLASHDAARLVDDYCSHLHCRVLASEALSESLAEQWGCPELTGATYWLLGNTNGRPWLRVVEDPAAMPATPLSRAGWMAMEVLVADVDGLAAALETSPFEILRPVANLELSEKIRAVQVQGPAGELLYLTQIAG